MAGLSNSPVWPTLAVKDLAGARKFYEATLGYQPLMSGEEEVAYQGPGNSGLSLYHSDANAGTNKATYASWKIDDLAETMADLRAKGVVFEEYDMPGMKTVDGVATWEKDGRSMKAAWFKDPDGNVLCLMQM
jgi:catechol 2,3-dioxygenase-like lactoylglutathione lyase family enzyme